MIVMNSFSEIMKHIKKQKESLKLMLCVHPPDSTLLDTLFAAWFHRMWVWYQPPLIGSL
jgi:hypothetical protein